MGQSNHCNNIVRPVFDNFVFAHNAKMGRFARRCPQKYPKMTKWDTLNLATTMVKCYFDNFVWVHNAKIGHSFSFPSQMKDRLTK